MDEGVNPHLKLNEIFQKLQNTQKVNFLNEAEKWLIFEKS